MIIFVPGNDGTMVYYFTSRYLVFLIFVPILYALSHKYSLAYSTSVKYMDIIAYREETSTMQCLALCDGTDDCTSINYNVDTGRCELTPHVPRTQTPASAAEPKWRVYYSDRIIPAVQAWQQSTFTHVNGPLAASYAIDGNRDNNDHGVNLYCAHTNGAYSYWAMEFEYVAEVDYVIIYFRNVDDLNVRNQNLRLLISTTRADCDNNSGTDCATFAGPPASPSPPAKITCTQPVTGKFLKIIHNYPNYLTLCEVEVYQV